MIQRSGRSARSLLPTSAATARTCSTFFLSSVSGIVKNCGAWGSMAPPITVDIMVVLLGPSARRPISLSKISPPHRGNKAVLYPQAQPASQPKEKQVRSHAFRLLRLIHPTAKPEETHGRGPDNHCLRQLRPHPRDSRRPRQGGGL